MNADSVEAASLDQEKAFFHLQVVPGSVLAHGKTTDRFEPFAPKEGDKEAKGSRKGSGDGRKCEILQGGDAVTLQRSEIIRCYADFPHEPRAS